MARSQRVALVTGGAQGIGKGITQRLLDDGMAVMIADTDAEAGQETAAEYASSGAVQFVQADISDEAAVQATVQQTLAAFGRLDALVNNAGLADPGSTPIEQLELADWNRVIATNLTGAFVCAKYAAPHLRRQRGAIVNIASTRAFQSEPHTEAYVASKGGIVALTHALAISMGPEVRVNVISPGWIVVSDWQKAATRSTPDLRPIDHTQHPAGRAGQPSDVAAMVAFLLSEQAGFITGQNIMIDGGMTRKMIYAE
ncbi:MAG: SDR family oxidoreductase [Chloroflexaceae bacterium]|nr:SDR family oxidoreductase [Chloroflexaceae bacterium]